MMLRRSMVAALLWASAVCAAVIEVRDADISSGDSVVWHTGDTLLLMEPVYVDSGAVLSIEPGVVVKGLQLSVDSGGPVCLVVARGGRMWAVGTKQQPIVFTAQPDDLTGRTPSLSSYGLWGGIAVCGRAPISAESGESRYTRVNPTDNRLAYGGADSMDNSGALQWVSIRFAGHNAWPAEDEYRPSPPAGLALCGVGSGTLVDHVEVFTCGGIAFHLLGGNVNAKYLVAAYAVEWAFAMNEGYQGRGQFWLGIQKAGLGHLAAHHTGYGTLFGPRLTRPRVANATLVADGAQNFVVFDHGGAGWYHNSIFYHGGAFAIRPGALGQLPAGNIGFDKCIIGRNVSYALNWAHFLASPTLEAHMDSHSVIGNPGLELTSLLVREPRRALDLRPSADIAVSNLTWLPGVDPSGFYDSVCFKGAFDPTQPMWVAGWTGLSLYGFLAADRPAPRYALENCRPDRTDVAEGGRVAERPAAGVRLERGIGGAVLTVHGGGSGERMVVEVYDVRGRLVWAGGSEPAQAGAAVISVRFRSLPSGPYVCRVLTDNRIVQRVVTLSR